MRSFVLYIVTALIFIFSSCEITGLDPVPPAENTRDFTWEVDSLWNVFGWYSAVWGTSPDNMFAISAGGSNKMAHFDGKSWEKVENFHYSPNCIFGFDENNIWIGGSDGRIYNYNGRGWYTQALFEEEDEIDIFFQDIWGESPDCVYAVGGKENYEENRHEGAIAKFDGVKWELVYIGTPEVFFADIRKSPSMDKYFVTGYNVNPRGVSYIFSYDGNKRIETLWKDSLGNPSQLGMLSNGVFIFQYQAINSWIGDLNEVIPFNEYIEWHPQFTGTTLDDIFIRYIDGIVHYNGKESEYIYKCTKQNHILTWALFYKNDHLYFIECDLDTDWFYFWHGYRGKE